MKGGTQMMKFKQTWKVAALSLATLATISGCSNDDFDNVSSQGQTVITAGFEQPGAKTRTAVNSSNQVVWLKNDAFRLFYIDSQGSGNSSDFTTSDDTKQTSASFTGKALPAGATAQYAVYPAAHVTSLAGSTVTMTLPATITAGEASNGPMWTDAASYITGLEFSHLAGLLKLTISGLPVNMEMYLKVTSSDNIAGTATANLASPGSKPYLTITDGTGASKEIKVTGISLTAEGNATTATATFYVPLPVATLGTLTVGIYDSNNTLLFKEKTWTNVAVARASIRSASFGFEQISVNENISDKIQSAVSEADDTEPVTTTVEISGELKTDENNTNKTISVPAVENKNVALNFDQAPTTSESSALTIQNTTTTSQTDAVNTITLSLPATTNAVENVVIDTPQSTFELTSSATGDSEKTKYTTITATTANNTLVVGDKVEIGTIKVNGGNIRLKKGSKVTTITRDDSYIGKLYIYKETGASYDGRSDENVEVIEDTQDANLETVLAKGGTYILPADITLTKPLVVSGSDVTIDLNGYTITATNSVNSNIQVTGKLTLKDTKGTGKIVADKDFTSGTTGYSYGLIMVNGENALMIMEGGTIYAVRDDPANKGQYGVTVDNGGDFTMKGGKIEAGWYAVSGNGYNNTQNSVITIEGGELISTADYAIYLPQSGTTTIKGGKVNGAAGGVAIQRGTLNIVGGEILSTDEGNTGTWSDGTGGLGNSALIIAGKYGDCTVNISGGTISSQKQAALIENMTTQFTKTISVTGGTFSDPSVVTNYLAENANVKVVLNKDYTGPGFGLYYGGYGKGATIDVDLNSFTWNVADTPLFGSTGYESQYFHLEKETTVTFKNGTIQPKDNGGKMMIQNYCNLTLENVSVFGGTNCSYVVSNNNGKCDINNSTITAKGDNCAFDVYSFNKYEGVTVTITGSSVINGKVEFGGNNNKQNGTLIVNGGTLNGNLVVTEDYVKEDKSNLQVNGGTWGDYSGWSNYTTSSYPPSNK